MLSSPVDIYAKNRPLLCAVVVYVGEGGQLRPYINFQKYTMTPLSPTVYRKFVGVGG